MFNPVTNPRPSNNPARASARSVGTLRIRRTPFRTSIRRALRLGLLMSAALTIGRAATTMRIEVPTLQEVPRDRAHELRVLYLEDPRLPTLNAAQRGELLTKVEHLLRDWHGYRVRLREVGAKNLADYFATHAAVFRKHTEIVRMAIDPTLEQDRARLRAVIQGAFAPHPLARLERHFPGAAFTSHEQAVTVACDFFVQRCQEIRSIPLSDGGTLAVPKQPELNSYMHWCALMHEMEEADLVFTNSMIVGADMQMPLSVIARGGVTTGNTNANRHNAFQAAAMVGLFPFLSDAPFWLRERGPIPEAERLDVIATMTMHELGHMLLRLAHPEDHPGCVHAPAGRLRYYDWHADIRQNGPCRLEHTRLKNY
jgi:hypothetical protein